MTEQTSDRATRIADLTHRVLRANRHLGTLPLVAECAGNASGVDRDVEVVVIKPSGVPYEELSAEAMVALSLDGEHIAGELRASADTPTHLELYRRFPSLGGIVHTHSEIACAWAQAGRPIPVLGTTHADGFAGPIPCTRRLSDDEIAGEYELATGRVIAEAVAAGGPEEVPGALVRGHGPFAWGPTVEAALANAEALERVAHLAFRTLMLAPETAPIDAALARKHYRRKHGPDAYYGQPVARTPA